MCLQMRRILAACASTEQRTDKADDTNFRTRHQHRRLSTRGYPPEIQSRISRKCGDTIGRGAEVAALRVRIGMDVEAPRE